MAVSMDGLMDGRASERTDGQIDREKVVLMDLDGVYRLGNNSHF